MTPDESQTPETKRRAFATFKRRIEEITGKALNDLTVEEFQGAVAVIQAEAEVYAAERKGTS
jgi:uncharacterized small protein (DUF1192 family)